MAWKYSSNIFKDCDPKLAEMVKQFNKHFEDMEKNTPERVYFEGKENPSELFKQLTTQYQFFTEGRWMLESYRNRYGEKLKPKERLLIEYLDAFYLEFYPPYEQKLIGVINDLTRELGKLNDHFEHKFYW